jgi:hypothetical protein
VAGFALTPGYYLSRLRREITGGLRSLTAPSVCQRLRRSLCGSAQPTHYCNRYRFSTRSHLAVFILLRAVLGWASNGRKLKLADVLLSAGSVAKVWQLIQEPGPGRFGLLPV